MKTTLLSISAIALLALSACTVKHSNNGDNDKVDIQTPMGQMNVRTNDNVDLNATGLPVYPGAVYVKDKDGDKGANVNMSFGGFGLKVVALNFKSDDSPQKVLDFYNKEMKQFGGVLVCDRSKGTMKAPKDDHYSGDLSCSSNGKEQGMQINIDETDSNLARGIELKSGVKGKQHAVSVKPDGTATKFALVYVETHGNKGETM